MVCPCIRAIVEKARIIKVGVIADQIGFKDVDGPFRKPRHKAQVCKIVERFEVHSLDGVKIKSCLTNMKAQRVTNVFYLTADGLLDEDHVALLNGLQSMPIEIHGQAADKLFTLSMAGFYLFVFKLSVHFCRLHEDVDRNPKIAVA